MFLTLNCVPCSYHYLPPQHKDLQGVTGGEMQQPPAALLGLSPPHHDRIRRCSQAEKGWGAPLYMGSHPPIKIWSKKKFSFRIFCKWGEGQHGLADRSTAVPFWKASGASMQTVILTLWSNELPSPASRYWSGLPHSDGCHSAAGWLARATPLPLQHFRHKSSLQICQLASHSLPKWNINRVKLFFRKSKRQKGS